jgi:light-harvesting complex I chlorophyll a/b binding protein 1
MKIYTFLLCFCPTILAFQNLPGVSKPMGFFDPLGLSKNKSPIEFKKIQESELKHGRIAMLSSLGLLIQNNFHPLFDLKDTELGDSIYHYQIVNSKFPLLTPILISLIAVIEGKTIIKGWENNGLNKIANLREDYVVGDLDLNPFQFSEDEFQEMRTKELNNGRLAMIATLIIIIQQLYQTSTL